MSESVINTQKMTEFKGELIKFNNAMEAANKEIDIILNTPGIESEDITAELKSLKSKLYDMSSKWNTIAHQANENLNLSIEDFEVLQAKIKKVLEN